MNNWPFHRADRAPWWFPVLGVYSAIVLIVLLPILVGVLLAFGFLLYLIAGSGAVGLFLDGFLILALVALVWGIWRVGS